MRMESRLGIQVQRSQKWSALNPANETANETVQATTMPTLTLTVSGSSEASAWPPTTDERREKPVSVAALRSSGTVTR
jgi:hypothetical protein